MIRKYIYILIYSTVLYFYSTSILSSSTMASIFAVATSDTNLRQCFISGWTKVLLSFSNRFSSVSFILNPPRPPLEKSDFLDGQPILTQEYLFP